MRFFDLHTDTPFECFKRGISPIDGALASPLVEEVDFSNRRQCCAFWIKDDAENPFELYRSMFNDFKAKTAALNLHSVTPVLTVEGGALLEDNPERLYILKSDEICALTLTWNGKNKIASGAFESGGVTPFGTSVIKLMNSLKIACDLSHINREGFFDALKIAEYPFASHSALDEVCSHPRNLTQEQAKALLSAGGIIGFCFYPAFLGEDVFEKLYQNIFILCDMGFEDSIAIGSDFDGADMSGRLNNFKKVLNFRDFLLKKGLENRIIDKIFYDNADNFFLRL